MITYQQSFLHGTRGYLIVLKKKNVDYGYGDYSKNQGIKPFDELAVFSVTFLPEGPVDLFGDVQVEDYAKTEQIPEVP
jgi:hypothetical protein